MSKSSPGDEEFVNGEICRFNRQFFHIFIQSWVTNRDNGEKGWSPLKTGNQTVIIDP